MPNIKPISDLRNYTEVLRDVAIGEPVYLTKNGRGRYVILDIHDFEKEKAARRLMAELDRARKSGRGTPWEDVKKELGLTDKDEERREAAVRLVEELDKARRSGGEKTLEEVEEDVIALVKETRTEE